MQMKRSWMWMGSAHEDLVYELLGRKELGTTSCLPADKALMDGDIAFRQHEGGHTTGPNWPYLVKFSSNFFSKKVQRP